MLTLTELLSIKTRIHNKGYELDPHVYKTLQKTLATLVSLNAKTILAQKLPAKKK